MGLVSLHVKKKLESRETSGPGYHGMGSNARNSLGNRVSDEIMKREDRYCCSLPGRFGYSHAHLSHGT